MATFSRDRLARRAAALALFLAVLAPGAPAGAAFGSRTTPGTVQGGQFRPGRPAAADYGPGPACATGGAARMAGEQFAVNAKRAGKAAPQLDGRLCLVAEAFLALDPDAQPRDGVLEFVSQWFGLPTPVLRILVAEFETEDSKVLADRAFEAGGGFMDRASAPRWGLATLRTRRGFTKLVLAAQDATVDLSALPRRLAAGQSATFTGKLLGNMQNPKVAVSDAVGHETSPAQQPGKDFSGEVRCGDKPGRIQVEIRAERNGAPAAPVANFAVACAIDLPAQVAMAAEPWPQQPAEQERKLFGMLNEERTAVGLKPLGWDDAVAGVARTISEALRTGSGGDLRVRLKEAGIVSPVMLQSAAVDRTVERAVERLLRNPSNRANVMSAEATSGGVGIVAATGTDGRPLVHVTEILIKELPPVDAAKARDALRAAVAQKRKDARAGLLKADPALDEIAGQYARALAAAGGTLPKEQGAAITKPLDKSFRAVTMVSGAKQDALDFAEEPQAIASGSALGIGVAQGKNAALGRNATYVVLMIGTPRSEPKPAAGKPAGKSGRGK